MTEVKPKKTISDLKSQITNSNQKVIQIVMSLDDLKNQMDRLNIYQNGDKYIELAKKYFETSIKEGLKIELTEKGDLVEYDHLSIECNRILNFLKDLAYTKPQYQGKVLEVLDILEK
jgi:hypothetical protein